MTDQPEATGKVIRLNVGGKEGKLTTPVGSHIPVRVFERGGDFLMLVLMLDDGEELGQDVLEPLVLEYVSARGMVRFEGQAVLQERDLVRFEVSTAPEVTQRREFVRVPSLQSVVLGDGLGSVRIDGKAIDLSGGGMLLSGGDRLELESVVRFRLSLAAGVPDIEGLARVVRADDQGRRALVFEQISEDDRQRLIHFVFERQRQALAKVGSVVRPRRSR
jgi:PilZ domain